MPLPEPKYVHKIMDQAPPDPLPERLPPSALDSKDGFIHLSIGKQTPLTANMFFGQHSELWILRLAVDKLDGRIEWSTEPTYNLEGGCPHLHDSLNGLGKHNATGVIHATRQSREQRWEQTAGMKEVMDD